MLTALVVLAIAGTVIYRVTTPADRRHFAEQFLQPTAARMDAVLFAAEPCRAVLRARTPWLILTPVVAGLHVLVFLAMLAGGGSLGDPATLVDWGANHGPRTTTNGEWWRLLSAAFVQPGPGHLLLVLIGLVQVGEVLERFVGPFLVGLVYTTASVLGSIVNLREDPLSVHAGGAAGVLSLYGLLAAVTVWGWLRRIPDPPLDAHPESERRLGVDEQPQSGAVQAAGAPLAHSTHATCGLRLAVPVYQSLLPAAVAFGLYCLVTGQLTSNPSFIGISVGVVGGLVLTRHASKRKTTRREMFLAKTAAVCAVTAAAWPVQSIVDVRPELAMLVSSEDRQAHVFRTTIARYTTRQIPLDRPLVAALVDRTMLPQVRASRSRVEALERVLPAHQPLVTSARDYLRLREESWRLWAEGLRKGRSGTLREAERVEQASFRALQPVRALLN